MKSWPRSASILVLTTLTACYDSNVVPEFCNTWPIEWETVAQAQSFLQAQGSGNATRRPQSAVPFRSWQASREIWVVFRQDIAPEVEAVRRIFRRHELGAFTYRERTRIGFVNFPGANEAKFRRLFLAMLELGRLRSVQTISEPENLKLTQDTPNSPLAAQCADAERSRFPITSQVTPLYFGWSSFSPAVRQRMQTAAPRPLTVVVADTGVDSRHEDLRVTRALNFVIRSGETQADPREVGDTQPIQAPKYSHGTMVAGVIAAQNNGLGVVGLAPDVTLESWRTMGGDATGRLSFSNYVENLDRLANAAPISIVNVSGSSPTFNEAYARELDRLRGKIIVVASAGNVAAPNGQVFPARYPGVVSVGFTNAAGELDAHSAREDWVTVVAPGTQLLSTYMASRYACMSGASFSTPVVTGAFALAARKHPGLNADALRKQVICNASGRGRRFAGSQIGKGYGVVSVDSALNGSQQASAQGCDYEPAREGVIAAAQITHPAPNGAAPETMPGASDQLVVRNLNASAFRFRLGAESSSVPEQVQGLQVSFQVQDGAGRGVSGARVALVVQNASGTAVVPASDPIFVTDASGNGAAILLGPKCGTVRIRVVDVAHSDPAKQFIANTGETAVTYQFEAMR